MIVRYHDADGDNSYLEVEDGAVDGSFCVNIIDAGETGPIVSLTKRQLADLLSRVNLDAQSSADRIEVVEE
jgi:hypothetical protein